jgi:RNA polymerase sigma factor (sigma-70 family)
LQSRRRMGGWGVTIPLKLDGYRPLSAAAAGELARRAADGDADARWELARSVAPAVRKAAARVARRHGRSRLLDDMADAGIAAVWERCHLYDPTRGAPTTFASRVAWHGFRDVLSDLGFPCHVPVYLFEHTNKKSKSAAADVLLAADRVKAAPERLDRPDLRRLDIPSGDDGLDPIDRRDLLERLCSLRSILSPRERRVLAMRFRLGLKHADIGRWIGRHRERSRQIEIQAIAKLRAAIDVAAY